MEHSLYSALSLCLTQTQCDILNYAKILVVGAGGIGCELLKNLALSGFKNLHIIDLDSIDPTNLNRQYLFDKSNVGEGKSVVARRAILSLSPTMNVVAHQANINDPAFDETFFKQFHLVLNALDNNEARRYVNRVCVSLDISLIDSGSAGYNGQVKPMISRVTQCFECNPLPRQKSFPVCSIRSTPQKPEHCITWAKYFYQLLFGDSNDNILSDVKNELVLINDIFDKADNEQLVSEFSYHVFKKMFDTDIEKQLHLSQKSGTSCHPRPLVSSDYFNDALQPISMSVRLNDLASRVRRDPWSLQECVVMFVHSISQAVSRRANGKKPLYFSKDDDNSINFVTAAANLRMYNFNIPLLSRWNVESISASIIPAVASANAIVAGLQAFQAMKFLFLLFSTQNENKDGVTLLDLTTHGIRYVGFHDSSHNFKIWVKQFSIGPYILLPEVLERPKHTCYVCQSKKVIIRLHSLNDWTLENFINTVMKEDMGCKELSIQFMEQELSIYEPGIEEDDPDFDRRKKQSLSQWGITSSTRLYVMDLTQKAVELEVHVIEDATLASQHSYKSVPHPTSLHDLPLSSLYSVTGWDAHSQHIARLKRKRNIPPYREPSL